MANFLDLPPELRHEILSLATCVRRPAPESPAVCEDRVRLRDDWDIWVPVDSPEAAASSISRTCRQLRADIQHLSNSFTSGVYELDVMFVPGCGLWPSWTRCPPPGLARLETVRVVFRIFEGKILNEHTQLPDSDPDSIPLIHEFTSRFCGVSSSFRAHGRQFPNAPAGAWNFYRLLVSLLALGPHGFSSRALQSVRRGKLLFSPPRFSIQNLVLDVISQPRTEATDRLLHEQSFEIAQAASQSTPYHNSKVPYGSRCGGEIALFPGPDRDSPCAWRGPTTPDTARTALNNDPDRLGLWLANTTWRLLDFNRMSRGFGLILFEGIHQSFEFAVDGETRSKYDMDDMLKRSPNTTISARDKLALEYWKIWLVDWRNGVVGAVSRPRLSFPRLLMANYRSSPEPYMEN